MPDYTKPMSKMFKLYIGLRKNVLISVACDNEHWFCEIEGWGWLES